MYIYIYVYIYIYAKVYIYNMLLETKVLLWDFVSRRAPALETYFEKWLRVSPGMDYFGEIKTVGTIGRSGRSGRELQDA